ncbi:MAG: 2-C-methyl-D-erythritol 2,4-cyclodiphosphate synthase [Oscillospiraceae bacterium]|nr:2-C-methyl-D-erythritol 2,4-cyclodiphosphate synthase [Oscillospiraceae bacterium]
MRIGHGYDAHRLIPGRPLVLGGETLPFDRGLAGHSDADVLIHAIMDALLGAAGLGDIGMHFPDTDPSLKNISSLVLLRHTAEKLAEAQWSVGNVDATIIAQRPKLASYLPTMRKNIALALGTDFERVNLKATTEEKMGFTGTEQGIAAHAVALIEKTKNLSEPLK